MATRPGDRHGSEERGSGRTSALRTSSNSRARLPEATFRIVEPFLRHYYDFADADDLQNRSIADLYGAAMAHWQTAQKFVPGSERLRVYNPILEQHGIPITR
jgi:hypothetical protein